MNMLHVATCSALSKWGAAKREPLAIVDPWLEPRTARFRTRREQAAFA